LTILSLVKIILKQETYLHCRNDEHESKIHTGCHLKVREKVVVREMTHLWLSQNMKFCIFAQNLEAFKGLDHNLEVVLSTMTE
jgi:hypothetical protein